MQTKFHSRSLIIAVIAAALAGGCGKSDTPPPAKAPDVSSKPASPEPAQPAPKPATSSAAPATPQAAVDAAVNTATSAANAAVSNTPLANAVATPLPTAPVPAVPVPAVPTAPAASTSLASLSQDQMIQGLKDALGSGLQRAVSNLGHDGGFLTNMAVKIPMPDKLQKVESTLRTMKQDKLADDFVTTMNRAAEQAVPVAGSVFVSALKQMQVEDARAILTGPDNAATQYFEKATRTNLYGQFYPIVQKATQKAGVTGAYKAVMEKANVASSLGSFGSTIGNVLDKNSMDIDAYVTDKTLDGLFKMVSDQEKQVRQNPVARTTDLMKTVFGALKN